MKIGITVDIRDDYLAEGLSPEQTAEFDRPDTVEAIERALASLGHEPERIGHARALVARLAAGERWDLVFNIAEGSYGFGREAQVPAILDVYQIPYTFSDPVTLGLSLHKGFTKHVLRDRGLPTAAFLVAAEEADLAHVDLCYPLFTKPLAEGTGKGVDARSIVRDPRDLAPRVRELWQRFEQPVLVEEYLPGREFTVGIVGSGARARALGTLEVHLLQAAEPGVYSYVNKELCEELVEYRLVGGSDPEVATTEALALEAWRALGCRDGGRVDMRSDARGRPHVVEINPLAGLHPEHSDLPILCTHLGLSYVQLIEEILSSALARVEPLWVRR